MVQLGFISCENLVLNPMDALLSQCMRETFNTCGRTSV